APLATATKTPKALSQEKINEYAKIGEKGMAVSSRRDQILKNSEEVIMKFMELYQNIYQANKELQVIGGPISEELDHAKLQHETFQKKLDYPVDDLVKFGIFDHPRAPNKVLAALDYRVDQMEFFLEKIDNQGGSLGCNASNVADHPKDVPGLAHAIIHLEEVR
ncbi:hypothetical protein KI387_024694, partial [Taxus chinensis]